MHITVLALWGPAVFNGVLEHVTRTAWRMGFDVVAERDLEEAESPGTRRWHEIRESTVVSPMHGAAEPDDQGHVIVLHDALPHRPAASDARRHQGTGNVRSRRLADFLTRSLARRLPESRWTLAVRAVMPDAAALTVDLFGPEAIRSCRERDEATEQLRHPSGVHAHLSVWGERARVDLVEFQGRPAVRKTFRPGRDRYMARELFALRELAEEIPQIPELLDVGDDHFLVPYYDNRWEVDEKRLNVARRLLPLAMVRELVGIVEAFFDRGYSLIDCHVGHFLLDPVHGVKVIDFEFLHAYRARPDSLLECYEFTGPPDSLDDRDVPVPTWLLRGDPYRHYWLPHTGIDLRVLVEGGEARQRAQRTRAAAERVGRRMARVGRRQVRSLLRVTGSPAVRSGRAGRRSL